MRQAFLVVAMFLTVSLSNAGCSWPGDVSSRISGTTSTAEQCTTTVVAVGPDDPGITLVAIPARVRQIAPGSRPSDVVRPPASVTGPTATWQVVRDGKVVASVVFFHAPASRGWLVESFATCAAGLPSAP